MAGAMSRRIAAWSRRGPRARRQDPDADPAFGPLRQARRYPRRVVDPSPINPLGPRPMTDAEIEATIDDFVASAVLASRPATTASRSWARKAICSTSSPRRAPMTAPTAGAASVENRHRFPVEIVRRVRAQLVGRTSSSCTASRLIDLVEGGATADEIDQLALRGAGRGRRHLQHRHRLA